MISGPLEEVEGLREEGTAVETEIAGRYTLIISAWLLH